MTTDTTYGGQGGGGAVPMSRLRDAENRRFLHQMPIFRADDDIPDRFEKLLAQLEAIERGSRGSRDS